MAEDEDRAAQIGELVSTAEGYMSDAEFRDEYETRQIRYLQAMSNLLLAIALGNQRLIELLQSRTEPGGARRP
jgi:hypothetical protein